jgi:Skp family chaperone for outer membrane proteins
MKRFVCSLLLVLILAVVPRVSAQTIIPSTATVAFVSGQRLSNETVEGRAGQARVQNLQRQRAADLQAKQQALAAIRKQLAEARTEVDRARLQQQELQQQSDFERAATQAQVEFQALQRQIAGELKPKLEAAIADVVAGSNVQVVLSAETAVMWAAPGLDLTAAVIEKMDARTAAAASR